MYNLFFFFFLLKNLSRTAALLFTPSFRAWIYRHSFIETRRFPQPSLRLCRKLYMLLRSAILDLHQMWCLGTQIKVAALNQINKRLPKIKLSFSINPVSRGCYSQKCFHYIKRKHNDDYGSFVHKVLCF